MHARGLRKYFNPSWYSEFIILYTPYDPIVFRATFEKVIDVHSCFFHFIDSLESVSVCVFLHPCYLGFVTSFKNTNQFVKFMERI
ncbi:unnamed protein product [Sphagnum jensenii]|uniref:Maturase K n=1 Tax=Sphagnum jensenii TaxID=128206 RepID=A0ABP0WRW2_9BRYO